MDLFNPQTPMYTHNSNGGTDNGFNDLMNRAAEVVVPSYGSMPTRPALDSSSPTADRSSNLDSGNEDAPLRAWNFVDSQINASPVRGEHGDAEDVMIRQPTGLPKKKFTRAEDEALNFVDALEEHFSAYGELSSVELDESPQDNTNDASVSSSSNVSARVSFASRHFAEKAFSHGKSWKGRKLEFMWLTSVNSVEESGGSENLSAASDKSPEANIEPSEENAPSHYQKTAALGSNE